ncbi:hypothetical protein [Brevibacterium salitolerans]|uniref:Serine/threonine protein kinase n=1 Tax=Brevibacterium salitolerans TaxID=1403566 RepID=A0ABP5I956_9MICO
MNPDEARRHDGYGAQDPWNSREQAETQDPGGPLPPSLQEPPAGQELPAAQEPRTQAVPVFSPGAQTRAMPALGPGGQRGARAEAAEAGAGPGAYGTPALASGAGSGADALGTSPAASGTPVTGSRRPVLWVSLAAALVLVLGVGGFVLLQQRGTGDKPSTVVAETTPGAEGENTEGTDSEASGPPGDGTAGPEDAGTGEGRGGGGAGDGAQSGTGEQEGAGSGNGAGGGGGASGADVPAGTHTTGEYSVYANGRYGFSVEVPEGWSQREADNGDGLTLQAPEGPAEMRVYGTNTGLSGCGGDGTVAACQDQRREELAGEGASVTYEAAREDWFVLSGYRADGEV